MLQIFFPRGTWSRARSAPWNDTSPVREELFGVERLERHAETLAAAQQVTTRPPPVISLQARLSDNAAALLSAYRICASDLESGRGVVPAAEWLLDNYHLVEEQIREIRADLPPGYYRQLPKLACGPFVGYPRVFGLVWLLSPTPAVTSIQVHFASLLQPISRFSRLPSVNCGPLRSPFASSLLRTCDGWQTRWSLDAENARMPTGSPTGF